MKVDEVGKERNIVLNSREGRLGLPGVRWGGERAWIDLELSRDRRRKVRVPCGKLRRGVTGTDKPDTDKDTDTCRETLIPIKREKDYREMSQRHVLCGWLMMCLFDVRLRAASFMVTWNRTEPIYFQREIPLNFHSFKHHRCSLSFRTENHYWANWKFKATNSVHGAWMAHKKSVLHI